MKYAVIKTGGKQYKVTEGDTLSIERLSAEPEKDYTFTDVLLYVSDGALQIGKPRIDDVTVKGKILAHIKGEKIRVSRFKAKARYRKVHGHRQFLTSVRIEQVGQPSVTKESKVKEAGVKKPTRAAKKAQE